MGFSLFDDDAVSDSSEEMEEEGVSEYSNFYKAHDKSVICDLNLDSILFWKLG